GLRRAPALPGRPRQAGAVLPLRRGRDGAPALAQRRVHPYEIGLDMSEEDRARLEAEVAAAQEEVARLRADNAKMAGGSRAAPAGEGRELVKRAAASLSRARDRLDAARAALAVFEETGSPHGLVADEGRVIGTIAVAVKPRVSAEERERAIEAE